MTRIQTHSGRGAFLIGLVLALICMLGVSGCTSADRKPPFEVKEINLETLQSMMDDKDTFVLLTERDNCPFCAALNAYLDETKADHEGLVVYRLDTTDYHLMRENEGDMTLISDTENGKTFLSIFPYFLYTPTLYQIKDGVPVQAALGYDDTQGSVSLWDVDSSIDWQAAKPVSVWGYIKDGQGGSSSASSEQPEEDAGQSEEQETESAQENN